MIRTGTASLAARTARTALAQPKHGPVNVATARQSIADTGDERWASEGTSTYGGLRCPAPRALAHCRLRGAGDTIAATVM